MTSASPAAPAPDGAGDGFWRPGSHVLWRYLGIGPHHGRVHIVRPATVVRDDPELLAVWVAPGTRCVRPVLADGTRPDREPLATRFRRERVPRVDSWHGAGVLKLARPGEPWSVWLFWEPGWRFKNWYVNLEEPRTRWAGGVDSVDHFLDISVDPAGAWSWLDEDEFAQVQRDGLMDAELAGRVRAAGLRAVRRIEAGEPPFREPWPDWRPAADWPIPALPEDWHRRIPRTP